MQTRHIRRMLAGALAGTVAIGLLAVPATAAVPQSIAGTVTDDVTDTPLSGIVVEAYDDVTDLRVARTTTAVDGTYTLGGIVDGGTYYVKYRDPSGALQTEYYDDTYSSAAATLVPVSGAPVTGIDAELAAATVLSGVVTDSATALPLSGIKVEVYDDNAGVRVAKRFTDGSGAWSVASLAPGAYRIRFVDQTDVYVREWFDGVQYVGQEGATVVPLAAGQSITDIDASMDVSIVGSISGTVTEDGSGDPLPGIRVLAYDSANVRYTAITDSNGDYTLDELPPGPYRINFRDTLNNQYLQKWYPNGPQSQATPVIVPTDTDVTGIDISLVPIAP